MELRQRGVWRPQNAGRTPGGSPCVTGKDVSRSAAPQASPPPISLLSLAEAFPALLSARSSLCLSCPSLVPLRGTGNTSSDRLRRSEFTRLEAIGSHPSLG